MYKYMNISKVLLAKTADEARQYAIEWQEWQSGQSLSYQELADWQSVFQELADRFPELVEEFKENGII